MKAKDIKILKGVAPAWKNFKGGHIVHVRSETDQTQSHSLILRAWTGKASGCHCQDARYRSPHCKHCRIAEVAWMWWEAARVFVDEWGWSAETVAWSWAFTWMRHINLPSARRGKDATTQAILRMAAKAEIGGLVTGQSLELAEAA